MSETKRFQHKELSVPEELAKYKFMVLYGLRRYLLGSIISTAYASSVQYKEEVEKISHNNQAVINYVRQFPYPAPRNFSEQLITDFIHDIEDFVGHLPEYTNALKVLGEYRTNDPGKNCNFLIHLFNQSLADESFENLRPSYAFSPPAEKYAIRFGFEPIDIREVDEVLLGDLNEINLDQIQPSNLHELIDCGYIKIPNKEKQT